MKRLSELEPKRAPFEPAKLKVQECPQCDFLADGCSERAVLASFTAHFNACHGPMFARGKHE